MSRYTFSSESVSEGHPDKVCDSIADSILDAHLTGDPNSRVACEVLCKSGQVVLAGEITSNTIVDYEAVAREAIRDIGYVDPAEAFNADGVRVTQFISKQSGDIAMGVDTGGAGDQGIMFGYASDETPELMPLPIQLAHGLSHRLATARKKGERMWLRPDVKTQVSVTYEDHRPVRVETVLVSTQHTADVPQREILDYIASCICPEVLGAWHGPHVEILVNPTGQFIEGGPSADCGVTGRKIIVDTYGGMGRHGGGAFSGVLRTFRGETGREAWLCPSRRSAGRLRDRPRRSGVGSGGHLWDRRLAGRRRVRSHVRFPSRGHDRAASAQAPDLPTHHELRSLRQARPVLGGVINGVRLH
jgi:S-adenosylmethionine synthetase